MKLDIQTINHVGLVVKDRAIAERFYVDLLGFERIAGRPGWLKLNATNAIPLTHQEHVRQHQPGQSIIGDRTWWQEQCEKHLRRWLES